MDGPDFVTLEDFGRQAKTMAEHLRGMTERGQRIELDRLKEENSTMYAIVKSMLEHMRDHS